MQHLSRKILCETRRIDFVAKHWVTEVMKMHANLMGPSTVQPALDKSGPLTRPNDAILSFSRPSAHSSRAHSLSMDWMPSDLFFDHTSWLAQLSGDECEIDLLYTARGELPGYFAVRSVILGYDKAPARFFVETMNNSRALFTADSRQRRAVVEERVDQSVFAMTRTRMNYKARGLIDNNEIVVFEENLERNSLWQGLDLFQRWLDHLDFIAASNNLAWPAR
jgi:hypothetical protein